MKIENVDNKIIIYLFNKTIDINNINSLNKQIKDVFIRIMKRGTHDFLGYNKVNVYHNDIYGIILEVENIYKGDVCYPTIDIKLVIYKDVPMYLEFDDYCFASKPKDLIIKNSKYYLAIDNKYIVDKYIEYGKIKYKKLLNEID